MKYRHKVKPEYPVWAEVSGILLIAGLIVVVVSTFMDFKAGMRAGIIMLLMGVSIGYAANRVWSP